MVRMIAAWVLIVVGLAVGVSGAGMLCVLTIFNDGAVERQRADAARFPNFAGGEPQRPHSYVPAATYIVAGCVLFFAGVKLRSPAGDAARSSLMAGMSADEEDAQKRLTIVRQLVRDAQEQERRGNKPLAERLTEKANAACREIVYLHANSSAATEARQLLDPSHSRPSQS
jgi:hypothetical protein